MTRGLGSDEEVSSPPTDWKDYSPLDEDAELAAEHFFETGELDTDILKGAAQTYAAATATAACSAVVGPLAVGCGYLASVIVGEVWEIGEDIVGEIGSWFSSDPPPPRLIELEELSENCQTLDQRWNAVYGTPHNFGIYGQMVRGLIVLKHQLGLPGTYDWLTVTNRLWTLYGVKLVSENWNGVGGQPPVGGNWALSQGWQLVNDDGSACTEHACEWKVPRPPEVSRYAVWRNIPQTHRVAPPMLTGGLYVNEATGRWTLAQEWRLCRFLDDNAMDRTPWRDTDCTNCLENEALEWTTKFFAAITAETTWLQSMAAIAAEQHRQQTEQWQSVVAEAGANAAALFALADIYEAGRPARHLHYFLSIVDFLGVASRVQGKTEHEANAIIARALEKRGMTVAMVLNWIAHCDPPMPPSWDPLTCFDAGIAQWRIDYPPRSKLAPVVVGLAAAGAAYYVAPKLFRR